MQMKTLPTRPKAEVFTVADILDGARRGMLRIPHFQTGIRWGATHVEELFDSILRGFPIGSLLLWKRRAPPELMSFGAVQVQADELHDALYIVDGQQRVTALVGSLLHPGEPPLGDMNALWVDLRSSSFKVFRTLPERQWIPVNLFGDRRRLQHWARSADYGPETAAFVDRAFEIEEVLIRYPLPVYIVRDADEAALRLIFSRTNNSGVSLKAEQVFQALFGSESTPKPLAEMAAALDSSTSFGVLPEGWLLRCVKAVAGLDAREAFREDTPDALAHIANTQAAMLRVLRFLQLEVGFLHQSVLPYRFPLIVLARFFHQFPNPHPRSRTLLARWLWRGALAQSHGASSHANVMAHLRDIGEDEHTSVQRLLKRVPREVEIPSPDVDWNGHSAVSRLYATAMLHPLPERPDVSEIWTQDVLQRMLSKREPGRVFRALHQGSSKLTARVLLPAGFNKTQLRDASDEVLNSLLISGDAITALRSGDIGRVEALRAGALLQRLKDLVDRLAAPGAPDQDRPPISVLLATG